MWCTRCSSRGDSRVVRTEWFEAAVADAVGRAGTTEYFSDDSFFLCLATLSFSRSRGETRELHAENGSHFCFELAVSGEDDRERDSA